MHHDMDSSFSTERQHLMSLQLPDQTAQHEALMLPSNISSYFRRPTRIAKTNSKGASPRNLSRRKTTASHSTTRPRTLLKGSLPSYGPANVENNDVVSSTRPLSWHPNSIQLNPTTEWRDPPQFPDSSSLMHFMSNPFATTEAHGLITPLPQPSSSQTWYNETLPTPEGSHNQTLNLDDRAMAEELPRSTYWPFIDNPYYQEPISWTKPHFKTCPADHQPPLNNSSTSDAFAGTAPLTPEILPRLCHDSVEEETSDMWYQQQPQQQGREPVEGNGEKQEVLVGMGLYDTPLSPNAASIHGNQITLPYRGSGGKGLKLEETFEPPSDDTVDNDEGSNADSEQGGSQQGQYQCWTPIRPSTQFYAQEPQSSNAKLSNRSFFFDDDQEVDNMLLHPYGQKYAAPAWTNVYTGAPCTWI